MIRAPRLSSSSVGLLLAALVALAALAERRGNVSFPLIDLTTGWALLAGGVFTARGPGRRFTGALLFAAGASWFVVTADLAGALSDPLTFMHRGLLVHALLRTSGRATPFHVAVVVVAYAGFVDPRRAFSMTWVVGICLASIAVLASDAMRRQSSWRFTMPASLGVLLWSASVGILLQHDVFDDRTRSLLYGAGLGLAALSVVLSDTRLLARTSAPTTADIVRDGGPTDLRIGLRVPGSTDFEEVGGQSFLRRHGEATVNIDLGADLGEAVVAFPSAVVDVGRARRELTEGVRLLAANHRALRVTRSRATAVAESEQRIREADERAASQIGLELDRLVVRRIDQALALVHEQPSDVGANAYRALLEVRAEVQTLAAGLTPTALDGGLRTALASLADQQPVPVYARLVDVDVHPQVARALYFAAAECLTNAVRHACASRIELGLRERGADAELTVTDDGSGGARIASGGGLAGLALRLELLGGGLVVRGGGEGGTVITVHLPLAPDAS